MEREKLRKVLAETGYSGDVSRLFRAIAGDRLGECAPCRIPGFESIDGLMHGDNEELTESVFLDAVTIIRSTSGSSVYLVNESAPMVARVYRRLSVSGKIGIEEQRKNVYGLEVEGKVEKASEEEEVEEKDTGDLEPSEDKEEKAEEKPEEKPEDESKNPDNSKEEKEKLLKFYSEYIAGAKNELLKRYAALFASGYEVNRPDGLLTKNGIISLSGSELVVKEDSASTTQMYSIFHAALMFEEVEVRSLNEIANRVYAGYNSGKKPLYFPYKMVEFAYGREPSGMNAESLKTYKRHSEAASWKGYSRKVLDDAITRLMEVSVLRFLELKIPEGEDKRSMEAIEGVLDFLGYFQTCLSECILMMDYKKANGKPIKFAVRVCDPEGMINGSDITKEIIAKSFMGGSGEVPFSYAPRIDMDTRVYEYAHEFNHDMSQAMPLFAYKALDALKAQGVKLSWKNAIMGTFEDGSILRNGTHGVDMSTRLIHWLMAGSRAGKGVMTLNLLASAIASRKNIFYLDRKPDMASVLKYVASGMPVVNGGGYAEQYDKKYRQFTNLDSLLNPNNIPREALQAFQTSPNWDELGDIVYMRFLKLVVGIIVARAEGKFDDSRFGGKDGIFLVVDEFKNFQDSFATLCTRAASMVPPSTISKDRQALEKGSITQETFDASYNDAGYYALSFLNSLAEDMKFLAEKTDAGFNQEEIGLSDIVIIGQSLERGAVDRLEFMDMLRNAPGSARYRSAGSFGLKGFSLVGKSVPFNLVSFKPMDAFFGRNMDDGRSSYLAQTNKESKAYGRLDDKASNFAYMSTFTEEKRQKIVRGGVAENISLANSCTYFKPFLILNTGDPSDDCVVGCKRRCLENGGVSEADLIAEYPNDTGYGNPDDINPCVGFEDYLKRAGMANYRETLEKSSLIANFVVRECLGYPGNWFDFITDLRPEWMFTIRDISDGAKMGYAGTRLTNMESNPVFSEWCKFNSSVSSGGCSEGSGDFFYDDGSGDDFSDPEETMSGSPAETVAEERFNVESALENGEEIDLFASDPIRETLDEVGDSEEDSIKDVWIEDSGTEETPLPRNEEFDKIAELIRQLQSYGVDIQVGDNGWVARDLSGNPIEGGYRGTDRTEFGEDLSRVTYNGDIESLEQLVEIITKDVLEKFGGVSRVVSFKVVGGSIIVNGYYYRCKVKDMYARNIPYDVRRDINAGNISGLFNYAMLTKMNSLRDLEFDSATFVYDNVSSILGYGSTISVDRFFKDFRMLQTLTIGNERFTRQNYMQKIQGNDLFYKQRVGERFAMAVDSGLGKASSSTWNWTKRLWGNKKHSLAARLAGGIAGGTVAATSKVAQAGVKFGSKLPEKLGAFGRGVKDLFNT